MQATVSGNNRLFINGSLSHVISLQRLPHNTLRRYGVVGSYKTSKLKCKAVSLSIGPLMLPRSFFHRDVAIILLRLIQVQLMSFVTIQCNMFVSSSYNSSLWHENVGDWTITVISCYPVIS